MLRFKQLTQLPANSVVSVPISINTDGKEINALQVKINIDGEVNNLEVVVASDLPLQALFNEVRSNQAVISLTHQELGKSWSTQKDVEVFYLKFKTGQSGSVKLSFDRDQTMAGYVDSNQKIAIGETVELVISNEAQTAELIQAGDEKAPVTTSTRTNDKMEVPVEKSIQKELSVAERSAPVNNYLLTWIAAISIIVAVLILLFNFKKGKEKSESNLPN